MGSREDDATVAYHPKVLSVALSERDPYTQEHCERVLALAVELGHTCTLSSQACTILRNGAMFHDVGKIGIPDEILFKDGPLSDADRNIMKQHSAKGERIIKAAHLATGDEVARVIRHHHEAFDGSGYPDGLAGQDIPLLARLLCIVDAYDAMATERPYRPAMSHRQIMATLKIESGKRFDPQICRTFSSMIENSQQRAN